MFAVLLLLVAMAGCVDTDTEGGKSLEDFFEETVSNASLTDDGKFETKTLGDRNHFFIVGKVVRVNDSGVSNYISCKGCVKLIEIEFEDETILEVEKTYLYKNNSINGFSVGRYTDTYKRWYMYIAKVVF